MNEKKKLQPKVRFREFTGENAPDWEQRKLESICDVRDGTHESPQYYSTGFPLITSKNVKEGSINYEGVQYISKTDYEKINQRSKVDKNDILIGMIGTIGNIALIRNEANFAIKNVALVKNIGEVSHVYLFHYLSSTIVQKQLQESMDGGTQKFISLKKIRSLKICISSSDEQNHIGHLFEKLDKLITLHQRKLEQLEQLKNTLLSKMFPKSGTNIPEIRFSGFTDAWKQRKAKEIFITISEKGHIDLPVLSASQEFGMVERNNIGIDIKYDLNSIKNYKRVLPKQFVIHLRSFQGGFAWSTIEGITSPAYTVIDFIEKSNQDFGFWKIFLTSTNFIKKLETVTYGIRDGRSISFNDFSSMNFVIPNINEQERIGNLFQKIDNYIAIHQRKLEQLKNLKQTLLNKMFI